jgi:hypothetical protein
MRSHNRARLAAPVVAIGAALALASPAFADYTARGTFLYQDREFGPAGFTGNEPNLPIRLADVEVMDANTNQVLASGATDRSGNFTISVVENTQRDVKVRAKTTSDRTPGLFLRVVKTGTSSPFAVSFTTLNHASNANIDFTATPVIAVPTTTTPGSGGGDQFNTYDVLLNGLDLIASLNGGQWPPISKSLTANWDLGSLNGTYYVNDTRSIYLVGGSTDSDGYDDTVISHEEGHYAEFQMGASDNAGGAHYLNGHYDLSLTWSEGWATYFSNTVRDFKGLSRPDIYVDTTGQPGVGHVILGYEVETPSVGVLGADNEVAVNACLWDIYDRPATQDQNPGVDDDPMNVANGAALVFKVETSYFTRPTTTSISLEDFWDGWFDPTIGTPNSGYPSEMRQVFSAHGVQYFADVFESDNTTVTAVPAAPNFPVRHHTTYPKGDPDWMILNVTQGGDYVFETLNLWGADTKLDLFMSNGTTLLASNDDIVPPPTTPDSLESRIRWTASYSGVAYLRCTRKADAHAYGSYDLQILSTVPVTVSDVAAAGTPEGVLLTWHARAEGAFSHFDIERSDTAPGPYARRNPQPISPGAGPAGSYTFLDRDVQAGVRYFYRLVGVETTGESEAFGPYEATALAPAKLVLHPLVPNPFNPSTVVQLDLPRAARVSLRVFTSTGKLVRTLVDAQNLPAGSRTVAWDGRDNRGASAASGIYIVRLDAGGERRVQRAVLVR